MENEEKDSAQDINSANKTQEIALPEEVSEPASNAPAPEPNKDSSETGSEEIFEVAESSEEKVEKAQKTTIKVLVGVAIALVVVIVALVIAFANQPKNTNSATNSATTERHDVVNLDGGDHTHDWETNMVTVEAPLLTEKIEHPAEYETKEVKHTVCNTCNKVIDNETAKHAEETGHTTFTTNVPVSEKVLVKDAWTETKTVQEYQSTTVQNGEKCRICGTVRNDKSMDELMAQLGFKKSL